MQEISTRTFSFLVSVAAVGASDANGTFSNAKRSLGVASIIEAFAWPRVPVLPLVALVLRFSVI